MLARQVTDAIVLAVPEAARERELIEYAIERALGAARSTASAREVERRRAAEDQYARLVDMLTTCRDPIVALGALLEQAGATITLSKVEPRG